MIHSHKTHARTLNRALIFFGVTWLILTLSAQALQIVDTEWGIDGKVVYGRFNPLTFKIENNTNVVFDDVLTLEENQGFSRIGAPLLKPLYLNPGATRIVQFHPVVQEFSNWELKWQKKKHKVTDPINGPPAAVEIVSNDRALVRSSGFFQLPESYFPPMVGATDGLYSVALNRVPKWDTSRQTAFLQWLKKGGVVHLFQKPNKDYPNFDGMLEPLNQPFDRFHVGSGQVFRYPSSPTKDAIKPAFLSPKITKNENSPSNIESEIFRKLATFVSPNISWPIIFIIIIVYLLFLGPLHYSLAAHFNNYRLALLILLGAVALFTVIFNVIGRRGYDEKTRLDVMGVAQQIEGNAFEVTQWINAFVTSGDQYTFYHPSPSNLYSIGFSHEAANAQIINGVDGRFLADIPLYSARTFMHRGVLTGPDLDFEVTKFKRKGKQLQEFSTKVSGELPNNITKVWMSYQDSIYTTTWDEAERTITRRTPAHQFSGGSREPDVLLVGYANGGKETMNQGYDATPPDPKRIRIYMKADSNEKFYSAGEDFPLQNGTLIYVFEIINEEAL